ncbi:hypothetical protein SAMN02745126_03140 [Enhydrobacter aerosaccus]|uniref:Uncharacterized protein n=1 Tax=Enhydrobacter aerosaccus TaxID=225324 RepID=A0A1T4QCG0_9HYPH|nr:hypothetical protein [Enhydrobacter aerosaccus]SKA01480.1 hypothetical protein SAMN02745126_03140 [Enhydrobacter aerosaccus]
MPDQTAPDQMADTASGTTTGNGHAPGLGPVLREQAARLADRSKEVGVDTAEAVGKAAESAAHELEQAAPELASYVRNAASYTHKLADDLRDRKASDLLSDAIAWGRQQPLMALAGAAVLGFALARVVKSGLPGQDDGQGDRQGDVS